MRSIIAFMIAVGICMLLQATTWRVSDFDIFQHVIRGSIAMSVAYATVWIGGMMWRVFKCEFPKPITVYSGESVRIEQRITFDQNHNIIAVRLHEVEVVERPETKQVLNYDD